MFFVLKHINGQGTVVEVALDRIDSPALLLAAHHAVEVNPDPIELVRVAENRLTLLEVVHGTKVE